MEHARLFIAIGLSLLVFIVWNSFFVEKPKEKLPQDAIQAEQPSNKTSVVTKEEKTPTETTPLKTTPPLTDVALEPMKPSRTITVNLPLYTVKISEKGAVFKSFVLNKYRESIDNDSPLLDMINPDLSQGTVRIGFAGNDLQGIEEAMFSANLEKDSVDIKNTPKEISFTWTSPKGVVVEKTYVFSPETYLIALDVTIKNGSDQTIKDNLTISLLKKTPDDVSRYGFEGPSALINNKLEQIKIKKIKKKDVYSGKLTWIAIQDRYFMSAVVPDKAEDASIHLSFNDDKILKNTYVQSEQAINSNDQYVFKYKLFFGPKSMEVLKSVDYDLIKAVHFGMFDILAKPCVWIMNFIYDYIPNYGVAIVILTILTKILLWPLGNKSYKSMAEMKKIQPLMAEIKEKYKNDKKKMNEEMMGLYKTYKVNPLGGCLPMVVQIPVFFALYRMLYEAIELRHAPFFWWINDLSAPDRLFRFDFSIPFMQAPYGIPVLTIIMGVTMFIQQKMSPPAGDPTQAKMMMMMPIVFTVIFINFSSGLVLYWLVNNIISVAQQYYITKKNV
ncbi:MAG: membrane protein insertase YidC [Deltaproteobacteria bacterium]|jgi:YidC/Oxa1 family membrane protein insertase|nr:membrane protein insertase YidC [Deltaproteobacteria bacterium]